ncbi:MAG TPA: hypothetical protein VD865_00820 [Stenotrophomonas sp.]|nr:hypothetical protein [Stenotrophomonas sp.]
MRRALPLLAVLLVAPPLLSCQAPLLEQASTADANRATAVLEEHGIDSAREPRPDGRWQVAVPAAQAPAAAALVDAYGLPSPARTTLAQLFGEKSFISTPREEQVRLLLGLNNELSAALERLEGVLHAEVQLGLPRAVQEDGPPAPISAAVLLRYHSSYDLAASRELIRNFIAAAAGGLDPSRVAIVLVPVTPDLALADAASRPGNAGWFLLAAVLALIALAALFSDRIAALPWQRWRERFRSRRFAPRAASPAVSIPPQAGSTGQRTDPAP